MENHSREQAEWRTTIIALVVLGVILGVEQVLPISDELRAQIGVLTLLLMFGSWHMIIGLVKSGKS